jgi:hAT family C-terminal dimerisation region
MKQQLMKRDTDILRYWASKEYEFPIIAHIAKDHLAIPAMSAASECVFSVGSDIITKKRNRLSAGNTRRLLCLQDWGVLEEGVDDGSDDEIDLDEAGSWE